MVQQGQENASLTVNALSQSLESDRSLLGRRPCRVCPGLMIPYMVVGQLLGRALPNSVESYCAVLEGGPRCLSLLTCQPECEELPSDTGVD